MKVSDTYHKLEQTKKRIVVSRGGSSSWKTYSKIQMLTKWLRTWELREGEMIERWVATVVRKFRVELWPSVIRDFKNICNDEWYLLSRYGWGGETFHENKSELTYKYEDRVLEFIGLDDPEKAKWPRRQILYINEWNNIKEKAFQQLIMRTSHVGFIDFNPDDEDVWINKKLEQERKVLKGDVDVIVSTFRDNWFLPDSIVEELLSLKETDPDLWEVYWNGKYGKIKGAIFERGRNWDVIDSVPEEAEFFWYGMDFWYSSDPTVLIKWYKYWKDGIILHEVFREKGLLNTYENEKDKHRSIQGLFESYWVEWYDIVIADSSEPKSIEEISMKSYNIEWVKKYPWSVVSWIKQMKKYKIYITAESFSLISEFKKYVWSTNKHGEVLRDKQKRPIPIDDFNHGIDAWRYLIQDKLNDGSEFTFSVW